MCRGTYTYIVNSSHKRHFHFLLLFIQLLVSDFPCVNFIQVRFVKEYKEFLYQTTLDIISNLKEDPKPM